MSVDLVRSKRPLTTSGQPIQVKEQYQPPFYADRPLYNVSLLQIEGEGEGEGEGEVEGEKEGGEEVEEGRQRGKGGR